MARKKRKVSGPSAAPPVAADLRYVKPSRSLSARNSTASASAERLPASSARMPSFMPSANIARFSREASIMRERTSAAICSHTRGANSTKEGPISRMSAISVSCSSTKFTFMREMSA